MNLQLRALWSYRGFILGSVKREFQQKYQNSMLGAFWSMAAPLTNVFIYTVIFTQVMKSRLPGVGKEFAFGIYLCAGVLAWTLFAEIVTRCQTVFLEHANLIKKLNFPKICLPMIVILNSLVNFFIIFGLFLVFLALSQSLPGVSIIYTPFLVALLVVMASGLGVFLGVLNVFFRDVGPLFGIVMQFWFWFTPIVYPISILPDSIKNFIALNPVAPVVKGMQDIYLFNRAPEWHQLLYPAIVALLLAVMALRLFRSKAAEIVDEI